jgi:arginyl-tRNA synthetase
MKKELENLINEALQSLGIESKGFVVEHPTDFRFGDYATNAGIITGKSKEIFEYLKNKKINGVEKIELANGPGFITFRKNSSKLLSRKY